MSQFSDPYVQAARDWTTICHILRAVRQLKDGVLPAAAAAAAGVHSVAALAGSAGQGSVVGCTEHTCVNWDVWFSKRAEALEEALVQVEAVVVGSCGNAEHHHAKANGALLIVLGFWKSHMKRA